MKPTSKAKTCVLARSMHELQDLQYVHKNRVLTPNLWRTWRRVPTGNTAYAYCGGVLLDPKL